MELLLTIDAFGERPQAALQQLSPTSATRDKIDV